MRLAILLIGALIAAPAAAQAPARTDANIVVTGTRDRPSNWREAESDHVVVLSDGSEAELVRIAHNLERLHFLLSVLLGRVDQPDETMKLRVTLVGDAAEFDRMELRNLRAQEGPYAPGFAAQRYYDPREDGAVMAVSRVDGKAIIGRGPPAGAILPDLVRATSGSSDPSVAAQTPGLGSYLSGGGASMRFGGSDPFAVAVNEVSAPISAEGRIYAGFAQHYLLTYFPNAYPRWYVDGFGELFATLAVLPDGQIEYGRAPEGYGRVIGNYPAYPIADVLTGRYLEDRRARERWTPFHAWALAHMLFFSEARRGQLHQYLATIAAGGSLEQAASAFGDLAALQRELAAYDNRKIPYERMSYPAERARDPVVRRLTEGQAAFVKGRLELGARVELPPEGAERDRIKLRQEAMRQRDQWLARLRTEAARYNRNLEAQLLLAEAECRSGHGAQCIAAADRALAIQPESSDALAWRGSGQVLVAVAGPAAGRAEGLKAARRTIARANRADTENPLPLIAYYRSYIDAGETAPDVAIEGLRKAVETVPAAPGPRLMLGEALAQRGNAAAARRALIPIAHGAYESPEAARARAVLATIGA